MNRFLLWPLLLLLAACAGRHDGAVRQDLAQAGPYPWCEREIRAAESQPIPRGASPEEARILRGRHLSQACAGAWEESRSIRAPLGGGERVPEPRPRPQ